MRKSKLSLVVMVGMFVLVAGVAYALGQQDQQPPPPPPQQQSTTETPPPPPAETKPAGEDDSATDPEDPKAPKRFVPTQKTSADNNATFPVDI
jgi:outer membrane biosynthesis protein TonB